MKHSILMILLLGCISFNSHAQENVGIGTTTPHPKAKLQIESTDQGILIPKITTTNRNNMFPTADATAAGMLVYDSDLQAFYLYDGSTWKAINEDNDWTTSGDDINNNNTGNVGIGTTTPSAKLDVEGNAEVNGQLEVNGAIKIQEDATGAPLEGTIRWNAATEDFEGYTGSTWESLTRGNSWKGTEPFVEDIKIEASDAVTDDQFGYSVSLDGDYAIIGAWLNDDGGNNAGAAYIFHYDGTNWTEQAKLIASDPAVSDFFGSKVSINGDYALIGVQANDDNGSSSGAAYIFHRTGTVWTEQVKLTASDGEAFDNFGYSVSINGSYALIGARWDDDAGDAAGAAYVFHYDGTNWTEQAKLIASDGAAIDGFGYSVSIDGDYALIGAYLDDDVAGDSGSAYIFKRSGTTWTEQAKLTASDAGSGDEFGTAVSIDGNYALIGASYDDDDDAGINSGSAYVFHKEGTTWTEQAKLTASDASAGDFYGWSVSILGNYAVIGAVGDDLNINNGIGGSNSGSAYVFQRTGTEWIERSKLVASDPDASDVFGWSVSISDDFVLTGSYRNDEGGSDTGSIYFFK